MLYKRWKVIITILVDLECWRLNLIPLSGCRRKKQIHYLMESHFLLLTELMGKDKLLFCSADLLTLPPRSHLLETRVMLPKDTPTMVCAFLLPETPVKTAFPLQQGRGGVLKRRLDHGVSHLPSEIIVAVKGCVWYLLAFSLTMSWWSRQNLVKCWHLGNRLPIRVPET